jgi:hypothetical protein
VSKVNPLAVLRASEVQMQDNSPDQCESGSTGRQFEEPEQPSTTVSPSMANQPAAMTQLALVDTHRVWRQAVGLVLDIG